MKALRGSTGGGRSKRGTAHHKGAQFYFRHLAWIAGVYSNIERDADQNRFIELELVKPSEERWNAFQMISPAAAAELGKKMLAISIVVARAAERSQRRLERVKVAESIHKRILRNLSVPVSFSAAAFGLSENQSERLLQDVVRSFDGNESIEIRPQYIDLLEKILSSQVDCGRGTKHSLSWILQSPTEREQYKEDLHSHGVAFDNGDLFVSHAKYIDEIGDRSLRGLLVRIPGAHRKQFRLNNMVLWGVLIPSDFILENFKLEFLVSNPSQF